MIFCGLLDLCRIIFGIVVDLLRLRATLEAEILAAADHRAATR